MKKLLSALVISSALLAACSNDEPNNVKEQAVENTKTSTEPVKEITQEDAKKVVDNLVEKAKTDSIVKEITVKETDKQVNVQITFPDDISEEERSTFLFNYMLFVEKQYPNQEIKYSVSE